MFVYWVSQCTSGHKLIHNYTFQSTPSLEYSARRLKQAQALAHYGNWDLDLQAGLSYWSDETCRIYGLEPEDCIHTFAAWMEFVHPDDLESVQIIMALSQQSLSETTFRHRIKWRDGTVRHIESLVHYEKDDAGVLIGVYGVVHDITEAAQAKEIQDDLHRKLNERAEELARSNAELERFAFIASHDLQEPLRMVSGYLSQLKNQYDNQLDDKALQHIHYAISGAERMRTIVSDLLEYSRITRGQYKVEKVSVDSMLEEVLMLNETAIVESQAQIVWQDLPDVTAMKTPLQMVFQNLIGNAIKYRQPDAAPIIRISTSETTSHWQFSVSDNGIGIDSRYFDKIFVAFQRLHSKDVYSGSGIGLAICYQVATKHQGKIWVESAEGVGSTFHFTISKTMVNVIA